MIVLTYDISNIDLLASTMIGAICVGILLGGLFVVLGLLVDVLHAVMHNI